MGIHMTLREDVQSKLHACTQLLSSIATRLHTSHNLADAAKEAETFKRDALALIDSVIVEQRTELEKTMNPKDLERLAPEDVLLQKVIVTRPLISIFQTAMQRAPNFAESNRILEPMACAQQLLQAALRYIPEDPSDPLMDSTDVFVVE